MAPKSDVSTSKWTARETIRRWGALVGLVLLGLALLLVLRGTRAKPRRQPPAELGKLVRVLGVADVAVVSRAIGYGVVNARQEWEMVAQVGGRVIELSDDLAVGKIVSKGTVLLRIDPEDYRLVASQQAATVAGIRAQIAQLAAQEQSTEASLTIERQPLRLVERDLKRMRELLRSGTVPAAEVDAAERAALTQRKAV